MNSFQNDFLSAVKNIQEFCVSRALYNDTKYETKEEEYYSITSDVIYSIMELLDGYGDFRIGKIGIVNIDTGETIKDPFIELHDKVTDYIKE